jgi:hypothetical protein
VSYSQERDEKTGRAYEVTPASGEPMPLPWHTIKEFDHMQMDANEAKDDNHE